MKFLDRYMQAVNKDGNSAHHRNDEDSHPESPTFSKSLVGVSSKLNPKASPFHPYYEPTHLYIYNDGVPILSVPTHQDCEKVLHGIQDESLDENFPPDALDAAELEVCEDFNEMMAQIDSMEEREELARLYKTGFSKRWEARRSEGLRGRPRPPKFSIQPKVHLPKLKISSIMALEPYQHRVVMAEKKAHRNEVHYLHGKMKVLGNPHFHHLRGPIQQPRKVN